MLLQNSHGPQSADAQRLLAFNRHHWCIEACHYLLDWNWDENRCTIRTGHGPENITRLRRFAVGLIKAKSKDSIAATMHRLERNITIVFDDLTHDGQFHTSKPSSTLPGRLEPFCCAAIIDSS